MGILTFLVLVIVVGMLCYFAVRFAPMTDEFKKALPAFAIGLLVLLLIAIVLGLGGWDVPIPRLRQ